jgi:hypothetical protein
VLLSSHLQTGKLKPEEDDGVKVVDQMSLAQRQKKSRTPPKRKTSQPVKQQTFIDQITMVKKEVVPTEMPPGLMRSMKLLFPTKQQTAKKPATLQPPVNTPTKTKSEEKRR